MKKVTLNIPENQFPAFMKFISSLNFIQVEKPIDLENELTADQQEIWRNIKAGFEEFKLVEKGDAQARPVKLLLDELDA